MIGALRAFWSHYVHVVLWGLGHHLTLSTI